MKIDLPDEFLERVKKHNKEREGFATVEAFIENTLDLLYGSLSMVYRGYLRSQRKLHAL
jgi:hypothetical protein